MFLGLLTNRDFPLLKTLVFSLLNTFLNYDCDGYLIPYANNVQVNKFVDRFYRTALELLLILINYKPPTPEDVIRLIEGDLPASQVYRWYIDIAK
jgi:High-temperature-induced dauer-formation protein